MDGTLYNKEDEMSKSKKFMTVIAGDKKLLGLFSYIVFNFSVLIALVVLAFIWYVP
jgi:hypothetical protein